VEFRNISIIGLGLIGGSIAKAVKNAFPECAISAYDKPETLNLALSEKVIDVKLDSLEDALNSELIFIATPVNSAVEIFSRLVPKLKETNIITDVCGIKGAMNDIWNKSAAKGVYFGGHPMTGKEKGGYINSDPILFENAIYIISAESQKDDRLDSFVSLVKSFGARVMFLDPYEHDEVIAYVSHMPQLLSVALINTAGKSNDINYMDFAGGGFRDMTRIASSKFDIWESVIQLNKEKIITAIDNLIDELDSVKREIKESNFDSLNNRFEDSRRHRDEIPLNSKGFLNPLIDVFVFVKDEPGVVSNISSTLFKNNINIKDIELLKIREGTGGTFRLSFESEEDALKARSVLTSIGFSIKK